MDAQYVARGTKAKRVLSEVAKQSTEEDWGVRRRNWREPKSLQTGGRQRRIWAVMIPGDGSDTSRMGVTPTFSTPPLLRNQNEPMCAVNTRGTSRRI